MGINVYEFSIACDNKGCNKQLKIKNHGSTQETHEEVRKSKWCLINNNVYCPDCIEKILSASRGKDGD